MMRQPLGDEAVELVIRTIENAALCGVFD